MGNKDDQIVTLNDAVAATLRAERAVAQLTTRALADRSGVPERTLIRILTAERDVNVTQVHKLAAALGVTSTYIMGESERRLAQTSKASSNERGMTKADEESIRRTVKDL